MPLHYLKRNIKKLRAYEAKEIPCRVKLDANESPFGFGNALRFVYSIKTNRYPDPAARELRTLLAKHWKTSMGNILHGNGSDELIFSLIAVFGGPVLFPVPTFSMYGIIATALNEKAVAVQLGPNFHLDRKRMLSTIRKEKPHLVFISSPNNPTGNSFDPSVMTDIIENCKGIVVVDEAYQQFSSKRSFLPKIRKYPNLVVMRTLSKIGLAALRTGFIVASRDIIREVNKVRLPFNVNALSQAVAVSSLRDSKTLDSIINTITSERESLIRKMANLDNVEPFPSDANFILFRVPKARSVYAQLLKRGVLVRDMSGAVKNCLRVTIGTPQENSFFFRELKRAAAGL